MQKQVSWTKSKQTGKHMNCSYVSSDDIWKGDKFILHGREM